VSVFESCACCRGTMTTAGFVHEKDCPRWLSAPVTLSGWTCPACGSGIAPHVSRCPCVSMPHADPVFTYYTPTLGTDGR
jgi:hypothetical protein